MKTFTFKTKKKNLFEGLIPEITFADVAEGKEKMDGLRELIDFLQHPAKQKVLRSKISQRILILGFPGVGKTLLVNAIAGEAHVPLYSINCSEMDKSWIDANIQFLDLLEKAKKNAPAIFFIDAVNAITQDYDDRFSSVENEKTKFMNQLLFELDHFNNDLNILVFVAANQTEVLNPAFLRHGRFDKIIYINLPDRIARERMIRIHTREINLAGDFDFGMLARSTMGFSGRDLSYLCKQASQIAADHKQQIVCMRDFEDALEKVLIGLPHVMILSDYERWIMACHEAGHAASSWFTSHGLPLTNISLLSHHNLEIFEMTEGEPELINFSREFLLAKIRTILGGRAAEELIVGDVTTLSESDLKQATQLTYHMITQWGMGNLGLMVLPSESRIYSFNITDRYPKYISNEILADIEQGIREILQKQYDQVLLLLRQHRDQLERLIEELLLQETLNQVEMEAILGNRVLEPVLEPYHIQ